MTAETKSGTNQFRGDIVGTYTGENFRAETPGEAHAGKKTQSQDKEYGAAFGGPIIADVAHFFVTYEGKRFTTPVTVTPGVLIANIPSLLPPSVAAQLGPADIPFSEDLYFGKLDWEPTGVDRFELTAKVRRESDRKNIGVAAADSSSIDVIDNDTRIDARWERSADRWFNEFRLVYEDAYDSPTARGLGNGSIYTYKPTNDQTIIDVGPSPPGATQFKGQRGPGLQDDLTLTGLTWRGDHTVKTGVKFKRVTLTAADAENINPQFFYSVDQTGAAQIPWKAQFTDPVAGLNAVAESRNTQFGLYIQDDWLPTQKLTLNIGVRWDYERTPSYLDHVTPANVLAALNSPHPAAQATFPGQTYAQTLAKGGININDYISNGNNRSPVKDEIQPRFGVAYDLNADQQHVVFGGAGRAYDRDLYDYLQLEETKSALPTLEVNFNVPDHPCNPQTSSKCFNWDPKYLNGLQNLQSLVTATNQLAEVDMLNNHLKVPYSDQFSIGMRNRVGDWNTSATVARILSHDGFVFTLGNRYPNGTFFDMSGGNQFNPQNAVPGFGNLIIGNNGIETRTTEFLLSAEKLYTGESHWGATFAYTYTMAKQNRDTNAHYAFDAETIQQYPFILSNAVARHRFVATGTFTGPWGTTLAGKLTLATPIPNNDVANVSIIFPNGSNATPVAGMSASMC
ncbi:MAG: TonB-dependent receptor [Gammaproteobacteria bacterium]|nr:MAG: TonB-dependent receptor [Gammaproteobacteria bacterium]